MLSAPTDARVSKVSVVVGTRPEIVKMASTIRLLSAQKDLEWELLHTEQHYDDNMSGVFLRELGLPEPHARLHVGSGEAYEQTAVAMQRLGAHFGKSAPDIVLVQGDTNTVLAGTLAAVKLGIAVGHVEAGLRSHDPRMPEEINRRLADHASRYLYAPTSAASKTLRDEGVWGETVVTGNPVIDACELFLPRAANHSVPDLPADSFGLVTLHRAENVDDPRVLSGLVDALLQAPVPVVFPVHPRTRSRLVASGLLGKLESAPGVHLLPPQSYLEFLALLRRCRFVLTDSGGIQEEATAPSLRKRVLVARTSTERPEAVAAGFASVIGVSPIDIVGAMRAWVDSGAKHVDAPSPYGDGRAGERTLAHVRDRLASPAQG